MRTEMTPLVLSYQEADDILEHLVDNFFNEVFPIMSLNLIALWMAMSDPHPRN
uniref:Isoform Early E1A 6 kDa protein of Early E1A protein n=1 Tax=Human adenovirus A serotype 12 TaxID=28282 RepID=P03259-4